MIEFRPRKNPSAITRAPNQKKNMQGKEPSVKTSFLPWVGGRRRSSSTGKTESSCCSNRISRVDYSQVWLFCFFPSADVVPPAGIKKTHSSYPGDDRRSSLSGNQLSRRNNHIHNQTTHSLYLYRECAHNLPFNWI